MPLSGFKKIAAMIAENTFTGNVEDRTVLELGSFEGWFTAELIARNSTVTCIEKYPPAVDILRRTFPTATVIDADFHLAVRTPKKFDAVVLYGILYHSPSPLSIIEDIVNYSDPDTILLETWKVPQFYVDQPLVDVQVHEELVNVGGYRQVDAPKTCGLAMSLSKHIYVKAMHNLGYVIKSEFNVTDTPELLALVNELNFKVAGEYTIFTKIK
jgi:hypothetical protein